MGTYRGDDDSAGSGKVLKFVEVAGDTMTGDLTVPNLIVEGLVDSRDVFADGTKLDTIETDATADQIASEVSNTPAGNIIATDVQAALNELDTEKANLAGDNSYTGTAQFAAGEGVVFNGDSITAANTLDDYEEGTWTPVLEFGGGSTGITYTTQLGTYTKIGRMVICNLYLVLSNKGTSTGDAEITLPFTSSASSFNTGSLRVNAIAFADFIQCHINQNAATVRLYESLISGVVEQTTDADFTNVSSIILTISYHI